MTTDRIFYSDSNGIRIGTSEMAFGEKRYGTRNVSSASIETENRRRWPGISMMVVGTAILIFGYASDGFQTMLMGAAAFMGGSMYFSRRKPKYGLRLNTSKGPVFVLASLNKLFMDQVKEAIDRSIDASRASLTPPP
ncbi:MAG: DUF6232 family protein [Chloroflexi bacterium]|nr:DUF6232 family protein [Chloroflexota bacterium]